MLQDRVKKSKGSGDSAGRRACGRKRVGGDGETRALHVSPSSGDHGQMTCQNLPKVIHVFYMHSRHEERQGKWKDVVV